MFDISASWVDQTINMRKITDLWIKETILVQKRGPETHTLWQKHYWRRKFSFDGLQATKKNAGYNT